MGSPTRAGQLFESMGIKTPVNEEDSEVEAAKAALEQSGFKLSSQVKSDTNNPVSVYTGPEKYKDMEVIVEVPADGKVIYVSNGDHFDSLEDLKKMLNDLEK